MTYATQQDLEDRFSIEELVELTDRSGGGVIDAAVVADALADADAKINSYVARRYDLPLPSTPAILVGLAADIARFELYKTEASEEVRTRYDDAVKMLKDIAAGRAVLDIAGNEPAAAGGDAAELAGPARVFDRDKLAGF